MMNWIFPPFVRGRGAVGLLAVRLVTGVAFILHGWPKIQTPMAWMGAEAPVPGVLQAAAAVAEFGGGIALIVGLFTPLASLALVITMAVAMAVHISAGDPFVRSTLGPAYELAAVYFAISLMLLLVGPGILSLDAALFSKRAVTPADRVPAN
jgi:putative oxidoreductase